MHKTYTGTKTIIKYNNLVKLLSKTLRNEQK